MSWARYCTKMMNNRISPKAKLFLVLLIPIVILFALLFLQWRRTQLINQSYLDPVRYFSKMYPEGYTTKSISFGQQEIVIVQEKPKYSDSSPLKHPLLWVQGKNELYEIVFSGENGETGVANEKFYTADIDNDGNDELITEWDLWWGGSGGFKGLIVWRYDNELKPFMGYPQEFKGGRSIQVKNREGKVIAEYPVDNMNNMTKLDAYGRFYFGSFIYDLPDESHLGPHYWILSVYRENNGNLKKDISWNNGNELTTKGKYTLDNPDELFVSLLPEFKSVDEAIQSCRVVERKLATNIEAISEPFDPNKPPEGQKFYKYSADEDVWTETNFDVDADGAPERILTANTAMNHTPHVLRIVKNNNVIFKAQGANIEAIEVSNHKGFILQETTDWNKGLIKRTKYNYDNGKFIPAWYQENCHEKTQ